MAQRKWLGACSSQNGPLVANFHPQNGPFVANCDMSQKIKTLLKSPTCWLDSQFPSRTGLGGSDGDGNVVSAILSLVATVSEGGPTS